MHEFTEWMPETFTPCIPLHEYITGDYRKNAGPWVLDVFTPAPAEEADALATYLFIMGLEQNKEKPNKVQHFIGVDAQGQVQFDPSLVAHHALTILQ